MKSDRTYAAIMLTLCVIHTFWVAAKPDLPLGSHRLPRDHTELLGGFPSASEFARISVTREPMVFRGVIKDWPAFRLWTDDYIASRHGDEVVSVDLSKSDLEGGVPTEDMTLREFLLRYNDSQTYLISDMPRAMQLEVPMPPVLHCKSLLGALSKLKLWVSSGGTSSRLHVDHEHNLACVLDGQKQFTVLEHVGNRQLLEIVEMDDMCSNVDVNLVDLERFPVLAELRWSNMTVRAGDCIYVPSKTLHQVRTQEQRSVLVTMWWHDLDLKKARQCIGVGTIDVHSQMTADAVHWQHDGEENHPGDPELTAMHKELRMAKGRKRRNAKRGEMIEK